MKINRKKFADENAVSLRQKLLLIFITLSMIPLFFAAKSVFTILAQTRDKQEKKITKEKFKNEPIEILEINSDSKKVEFQEKFIQEGDWLKDFTIKFKNISDKPIIYISTVISFPETDSTGKQMVYFLKYGVNPLVQSNISDESVSLAANDTAELRLTAEKFSKLKDFLATRQHSLRNLSETHLTIMAVYFDDGTFWSSGTVFRPDPDKPGKFIPAENNSQEEE